MYQPLFIESPLSIFEGDKALQRLQAINDSRFETEDGVLAVDESRWLQAQAYERFTWLEHNTMLTEDRNTFHREQFGNYEVLPKGIGKVLELGCGVFTNLQHILPGRTVTSVILLDPLIQEYRNHPHCMYKDGLLAGYEMTLVNKPIEAWKTRATFDLIVMVNTLPHCYDALRVLDFIRSHLNPGGYLVIGEFPRVIPAALLYDVGHPIALRENVLEGFLGEFVQVYRNGWYFIGKAVGDPIPTVEQAEDEPRLETVKESAAQKAGKKRRDKVR